MITVWPAILEKNVHDIQQRIDAVASLVPEIHLDVMDGEFVPNTTVHDPVEIDSLDWKELKVSLHLMIKHPELHVRQWALPYVSSLVIHREAITNMENIIQLVREVGKPLAVAINPHTPSYEITDYLEQLAFVLVMGVEPGFSAQGFNSDVIDKIKFLHSQKPNLPIAVDGGVNEKTKWPIIEAGATMLCVNSYLFKADNLIDAYHELRRT